jgi:hypothetical protein
VTFAEAFAIVGDRIDHAALEIKPGGVAAGWALTMLLAKLLQKSVITDADIDQIIFKAGQQGP